jgi:uncharacterized iron-regulated membrane protein
MSRKRLQRNAFSAATDASIAAYAASGQRMHALTGVFGLLGAGLIVLLGLTWALGLLPGAVRLF